MRRSSTRNDDLPLRCQVFGHTKVYIDPTGGDPALGGPVVIPVCLRCGNELHS